MSKPVNSIKPEFELEKLELQFYRKQEKAFELICKSSVEQLNSLLADEEKNEAIQQISAHVDAVYNLKMDADALRAHVTALEKKSVEDHHKMSASDDRFRILNLEVDALRKALEECHERMDRSARKFHRNPGRWIKRKLGLSKK